MGAVAGRGARTRAWTSLGGTTCGAHANARHGLRNVNGELVRPRRLRSCGAASSASSPTSDIPIAGTARTARGERIAPSDPTEAIDPTEPTDAIDPTEPTEAIDPTEPTETRLRMLPLLPSDELPASPLTDRSRDSSTRS